MDRETIQDFIRECRPYMIQQLQKEIIYYLFANQVLTENEFKEINKVESREHQMILVLDILPTKQFHHLDCFWSYITEWYSWIIQRFTLISSVVSSVEQEKDKMLDVGEVPPLPSRHVPRQEEYANLCKYLYELKRNEYIFVHGMRGCGKSTLVVEVLRRSRTLTLNQFKQKVFWLTAGRESCVDELTIQQELCSKLMSNRGYNVQTLPLDSKSAKQFLKDRLRNDELEDCLLILDDVSSASIIQALDVGCRTLVTTDDLAVTKGIKKKIHCVKVSEGFNEAETLSLFSQCINSEHLPIQAKYIHSICKGFPLTVSLISSQLEEHKEDVLHNTSRWDIYVSKLKAKNIGAAIGQYDSARLEQVTSLYKAIGMSIESLHGNLKDLYQDFALFMDDVNIKAEVLNTLWELNKKDVEDIMREFERKCLVVRAWNHSRKCYIYCVHDLLLDYLKNQISTEEKERLHLKLIQKYQKRYGPDFNNFPTDDNYILLYLGYHLMEANLLKLFPQVYLNLNFIETKIMNFGAADLLLDLRKYQKFIAHNAENMKKYEDVLHFVKHIGACKSISNSDIVQFGLCEHKDSYVYEIAEKEAKTGHYFQILTDIPKEKSAPSVYYNREEIVAAVFVSDVNVIVANSSGTIKLINIRSNHTLISFRGHEKKVTSLHLTNNLMYFLSASDDCTVRVWYLNDYSNLEKNCYDKPRTPSPQNRQDGWLDPWPRQRLSGDAAVAVLDKHTLPVKHAQFSHTGTMIVSTAEDLKTILWKFVLQKTDCNLVLTLSGFEILELNEKIESCAFSNNDDLVVCAARSGRVHLFCTIDRTLVSVVEIGYEVESMSVLPGLSVSPVAIFVLGKNYFNVYDVTENGANGDVIQTKPRYQTTGRKRDDHYVCAAISWNGAYVAIGTKCQNIIIYELPHGNKLSKFTENSGHICNFSWSRQNTALMTTFGNKLLKIWHFPKNGFCNRPVKLHLSIFDAAWIWDVEDDDVYCDKFLVTAAVDCGHKIHVFYDLQEKQILTVPSNCEVLYCCVCVFDGNIIYGCKNGSVHLVNLDDWSDRQIMNISCIRLLKLKIFTHGDKFLAIVLVETAPGKVSLMGCMKRDDAESPSYDLIPYARDSRLISDFTADLKTNSVYVVEINHRLIVYSCRTAEKKFEDIADLTECFDQVKYCDISANFSHVVTGNEHYVLIRRVMPPIHKMVRTFENDVVKLFKLSNDGTKLAVGFADGAFNIYGTGTCAKLHSFPPIDEPNPLNFATGQIIDFVWSSGNDRLIVIYEREIILYRVTERITLVSSLFMSIDKIVCNNSFTKCVTVDSNGQFQVLKFPRD